MFLALIAVAVPWSPAILSRLLERRLSLRLDCRVEIERATIWPLLGRIKLHKVKLDYSHRADRFRFAGLGNPIWSLDEAVVRVRPNRLFGPERTIGLDVDLHLTDPLIVASEDGSTSLFPPLDDLARKRSAPQKAGKWRLSSIAAQNGSLHYLLPTKDGAGRACVAFSQIQLDYVNDLERMKEQVSISGRVGARSDTPLHGQDARATTFSAQAVRHGNLWTGRLQTDALHFGSEGTLPAPVQGAMGGIVLKGQAQHQRGGGWDFRMAAACPYVEVLGAVEKDTSLTVVGHLDERTSHGTLALEAFSRDSRATATLNLALGRSEDSQTTLSIVQLADGWFDLWNQRRRAHWPMVETRREGFTGRRPVPQITVTAAARLRADRPWIEEPRAQLHLSGVDLNSEYLPFLVRDVDLEAAMRPGRVVIPRCRGRWTHGWLSIQGTHEGPWWPERKGTTRLAWACSLRVEDLLTTLPAAADAAMTTAAMAALARRPLLEGDLSGSGTLVLGWTGAKYHGQDARATGPTTKTLQGTVALRRGRIEHPDLPAPITDIDGNFQISPQRVQVRSVRGWLLGTTATITATIEGQPFFWNKPTARCLVLADISIRDAARFASDRLRPTIQRIEPQGTLRVSLSLAGPLRQRFRSEDLVATGTAVFHDLTFRSPTWALDGIFHNVRGQIALANGAIRLTTATGQLERMPFSLWAEADPKAGRFWARLESSVSFPDLQQVIPRALSRWKVGGDVSGWFELEASGPDLFKKVGHIGALTSETLAKLPFQWDLRGEATFRDAEMTFECFPTSLTEIVGRVRLQKLEWTFVDVTSSWGKTKQCKIGGGGRFRPGNWPTMHMDLEAPVLYLDEWVRPWRRSRGARIPPRTVNPVFELTGTLRGPRAFYRGHPCEDFSGEFGLISPYRNPDVFRFSKLSVDGYDGKLTGQGKVVFQRGNSTCTLELAAQNVSLPSLIQCESGREQTFVGRFTGNGRFDWCNGESETLTGHGRFAITGSKFLGNIFFRKLGQLIRVPFLDEVSFATIETPFRIANKRVIFGGISMDGPLISMRGYGSSGFDHSLDFLIEIGFPHLPQYVWLLDLIVQYFGKVPATVFSLDLRGTWDDPQYSFHHLGTAESGLLDALAELWDIVVPSSPPPPPSPQPDQEK